MLAPAPLPHGPTDTFTGRARDGFPFAAAQVINALAAAGADVDAADSAGVTPLMRAAETGQPDKVMALLNAGAATRTKAADNRSALDRARAAAGDAAKRCVEILERAAP